MKNLITIALICLSFNVFAAFPEALLEDFTGEYQDPNGSATVLNVEFGDLVMEDLEFFVEKQGTSLMLEAFGEEIEIEDIPQMIDDLEVLNISNISVLSEAFQAQLTMNHLDASFVTADSTKSYDINTLQVNCNNRSSQDPRTVLQEFLDSCLNEYGKITLAGVNLTTDGKETKISGVNVIADGNDLKVSLKAKGMKVKGTGEVYYEGDRIRLKITKVKAGIFNLTKKIFKELGKIQSDKIIVNRPWVTLLLDTTDED
ncbi:MAG: hypothetical protein HN576_11560 [Bacteriovoracaceae bacterium]|nr:hypothetical protein [Bacteriovoracaceae bacterium]